MNTLRITLLIIQFGIFGFLLLYALPRMIKARREFKKQIAEINIEMEETRELFRLSLPLIKGTPTEMDIVLFLAYRLKWAKRHGKLEKYIKDEIRSRPKDFS